MNRAIIMKDRRLIEALDYIDDEYIASAALYKMRSYAESTRPLAQTAGQSVKKHWKHYLGFVACILALALATPLFTHLPEIINSFAAGWGEGTEDLTQIKELYELYPDYTPAPLTDERIAEIEKVWVNINSQWKENGGSLEYLGDFDGCVCFISYGMLCVVETEIVAGYEFEDNCFTLEAIYNGEKMDLREAYERGYVTQEEVGMMAAYHARIQHGIVVIIPPETTEPLYRLFPDYVPASLDENKKREIENLWGENINWFHETVDLYSINIGAHLITASF